MKLIIDTRERAVTKYDTILGQIDHEIQQITTGDYVVRRNANTGEFAANSPIGSEYVAVIERKSLNDYAASIKDGRHKNVEKLLHMRAVTGCAIVYIIEGPAFPGKDAIFAGIPYKNIQSSIFHLAVRDNITSIFTRDPEHTAETLVQFVQSMNTLKPRQFTFCGNPADPAAPETHAYVAGYDLQQTFKKSDTQTVTSMWAQIKGISEKTGPEYARQIVLADIFLGNITAEDLKCIKINGRAMSKSIRDTLTKPLPAETQATIIAEVPGISAKTAKEIIESILVSDILTRADPAGLTFGPKKRKLGKLAEKINHYLRFSAGENDTSADSTE